MTDHQFQRTPAEYRQHFARDLLDCPVEEIGGE